MTFYGAVALTRPITLLLNPVLPFSLDYAPFLYNTQVIQLKMKNRKEFCAKMARKNTNFTSNLKINETLLILSAEILAPFADIVLKHFKSSQIPIFQ